MSGFSERGAGEPPITKAQSEASWDMGRPIQVEYPNGREVPPDDPTGPLRAVEMYALDPDRGGGRLTGYLWLSGSGDVGFVEAVGGAAAVWHQRLLETYQAGAPDGGDFFDYWRVGNGVTWDASPPFLAAGIGELRGRLKARKAARA